MKRGLLALVSTYLDVRLGNSRGKEPEGVAWLWEDHPAAMYRSL
jgi:hypothetical protein